MFSLAETKTHRQREGRGKGVVTEEEGGEKGGEGNENMPETYGNGDV